MKLGCKAVLRGYSVVHAVTKMTGFAVHIFFALFFIQAVLISIHHCYKSDVIKACSNSSPCIASYAEIYSALASADDNSYNIESALYPATKPSSVRVFVNVYGPSKTDNSTTDTKFTWSLNCLYAAIPAAALEVLSLGSILLTSRTQELNITIPQFCCNVSVEKRKMMIKDVLAALQDLAVSPNIRDPRLNTAECVIKGHQPDIEATGRSVRIRAILWCSFFSVLILGPLLAFFALDYLNAITENSRDYCVCCKRLQRDQDDSNQELNNSCCCKCSCCYKKEKPMILSVKFLFSFLFLLEVIFVIYVRVDSAFHQFFMLVVILLEGFVICIIQCAICKTQCCTKCKEFCENSHSFMRRVVFVAGVNVVLYHLFWLVIGIMINPTWGLTVLLVVSFVIVTLFYAVFMICDVDKCCSSLFIQRFSIFSAGFLGLCLAAAVPVLAGQSFYGRETADDVLKTALLYVINFLGLWMYRNRNSPAPSTTPTTQTPPAPPYTPVPSHNGEIDMDEEGRPFHQTSRV